MNGQTGGYAARHPSGLETRGMTELRAEPGGRQLFGYASVWGNAAEIGGTYRETVKRGAFAKSIASGKDILLLADHQPDRVIARTRNGSLSLVEDDKGLAFTATAPNTTLGDDVLEMVRSGLMGGVSIGFRIAPGGDQWSADKRSRTLLDLQLEEVSAVAAHAAYAAPVIHARAMARAEAAAKIRRDYLASML